MSQPSPVALLHKANLSPASAGARCFATVEKFLVSVTQPGEQYRGLWKGCIIIPGAFWMDVTVSIGW